jgi:fatty acid desaturase
MSEATAADLEAFDREVTALGEALRRDAGPADLRHLRMVEWAGRLCSLLGLATAWIAPNPASVFLLAQGMMARFIIGHQIGHGSYDGIVGVPKRYCRKHFARGWRRFVDWLDWWNYEDWLYTHNQLHHPNTQTPLDGDVMDSRFLIHRPKWVRVFYLVLSMMTWKFSYYGPRMRRERALKVGGQTRQSRYGLRASDLFDLTDPVVRTLWMRDYGPYIAVHFVLPTALAALFGLWVTISVLLNLILAELCHNAHTFICIRPSHCAADIPLFPSQVRIRQELHLQSVLGTVNYRNGGSLHAFLHGWQNYQIEHHLWPTATLLQCKQVRPKLVSLCRTSGISYREGSLLLRFTKTARLFMGLEHQMILRTLPPRA